jgi:hypothetical protein
MIRNQRGGRDAVGAIHELADFITIDIVEMLHKNGVISVVTDGKYVQVHTDSTNGGEKNIYIHAEDYHDSNS